MNPWDIFPLLIKESTMENSDGEQKREIQPEQESDRQWSIVDNTGTVSLSEPIECSDWKPSFPSEGKREPKKPRLYSYQQ